MNEEIRKLVLAISRSRQEIYDLNEKIENLRKHLDLLNHKLSRLNYTDKVQSKVLDQKIHKWGVLQIKKEKK